MTGEGAVKRSRAGRVLKPVPAWWVGEGRTCGKRNKVKNGDDVKRKSTEKRRKKRSVLEIGGLLSETEGSTDRRKRRKMDVNGGDYRGDDCSWNWPVRNVGDDVLSPLPWH